MPELAIDGGPPVRRTPLPYGRQTIETADLEAVQRCLQSGWLTTGPAVPDFESALADFTGAPHAVAVCNGTAALHTAYHALGVRPGDEVIVPALTFAATANAVLHAGATPVFADVDAETLLLDPACVERLVTPRTKAVVAVDYAGQPADYRRLREICDRRGLRLLADAAHSLGGDLDGRRVGTLADATTLSFHPVKHITTGEGGAVLFAEQAADRRARTFRNHGITTDHRERAEKGAFEYDMVELGYNYRLTDLQASLGSAQLARLPGWLERRRSLARAYDQALAGSAALRPLAVLPGARHAWHLYVVQLDLARLAVDRARVHRALHAEGIAANVHYRPVHLHSFYRERLGTKPGMCPVAEAAYPRLLSLPMFSGMTESDVADVAAAVAKIEEAYAA